MKTCITFIFTILILQIQGQVTVDWYNYPGGVSIATDLSNNVYTANWEYNPGGDITLTKRNASGVVQWNVKYDNTDNTRHEAATWVAVDNNSDILVSGTIRSGYSNPVNAASVLMKFNPSGVLLWRVVYENSFDGSSTRKCLVDGNNNIYVLGIGTGPNGQVTKVKKFNSSGATLWNYFDSGIGAPITFKFTPDNKILIIHRGITGSINGYSKIDLNGNNIWSLSGIISLSVGDAAGDASGNSYIINGATSGSVLKKLSPTGSVIWSQSNTINGNKVEVGSDNNPVIGGYPAVGYGAVFMKYDNNGNFLWQNLDADGASLSLLALAPMKLDASNAAYLAGSTMSSMGICKVNSSGVSQWAVTTPSGYPVWFVFGNDGNIYVTGGTTARYVQSASACAVPAGLSTNNIATTTATFNWAAVTGATSYNIRYRIQGSPNWITQSINAPANSVTISGLVSLTNYEWQIQAVCQSSSAFSTSVNFRTVCSPITASIIGSTILCEGTFNLLSANTGTGLTYQWKLNGTNISGATNATFSATTAGSYTCVVSDLCSSATSNTLVLTPLAVPPTPGKISGQKNSLCGGVTKTYSISPVNFATGYTWTVPSGTTINNGQGTVSISVTFPSNFSIGTISVKATNNCGASSVSSVNVSAMPAKPSSISGPSSACANQTLAYSTIYVSGATSYTWIAPSGATILSGQGTDFVTIKFGMSSGYIRVRANNSCGSSSYRSLPVSITCRQSETKIDRPLEINIYPNPSNSAFRILVSDGDIQSFDMVIADLSGRVVESYSKLKSQREFVFGENFAAGVYIATIWINDKPVTMRLIKQ